MKRLSWLLILMLVACGPRRMRRRPLRRGLRPHR